MVGRLGGCDMSAGWEVEEAVVVTLSDLMIWGLYGGLLSGERQVEIRPVV